MKKALFLFALLLLITMSTGCAWTKQHVQLDPQITVASANVGNGMEVGVKVVDQRPDVILGHRSVGAVGAEMTIDEHPEVAIEEAIKKSLESYGFVPVEYNTELTRNLKVEIRDINFYISMGFWTGGVHTSASFDAVATNNGKTYEEFYRQENERRVAFVPGAKENARDVNETVSKALQKIHDDQALIDLLAK